MKTLGRSLTNRLAALGAIVLASACAPRQVRTGAALERATTTAPVIDSLVPRATAVHPGNVVRITVWGRGFAAGANPGRNTVHIGSMVLANVPANASGTTLQFVVPASMSSGGEAAPVPLRPGPYPVTVVTAVGTSNAQTLTVTP